MRHFGAEDASSQARTRSGASRNTASGSASRLFAHAAYLSSAIATAAFGLICIAPDPVHAQADILRDQLAQTGDGQPLLLQADEMIYDRRDDRVIARGNVEVYYNNYSLVADELIYDQKSRSLSAVGNVRIREPDGSVINADRINLTDDFREGFIRSLRIVTEDDTRIAAARAYREGGETTVFERGVYTPCKICEDDPDATPLWRIKARKIIHRQSEGNIYYEDASLEFMGVPIAYTPYFYHADPSVKRRSGFLSPTYRQSGELGFSVETPYYFALAPDYDLTLAPVVTTDAGVLVKADWRQRLESGAYRVMLAGSYNDDPAVVSPTDSPFRGSIKTEGLFRIGSFWNWGWDITADTDDTFRRFYKLDGVTATERTSQVFLTGLGDRSYFGAYLYAFQNISKDGSTASFYSEGDTIVYPSIDYNYIHADPILGGELRWDTSVVALSRADDGDVSRVVTELGWRRTLTDGLGQRVTPFASARTDVYGFTSYDDPLAGAQSSDTYTRQVLTGGVDYRLPLVKHTQTAAHVIEPIVQVIARTDVDNGVEPPNEDAQSLVFDDTLLFDTDKFSGYDRVETGTRVNYGVQYTLQSYYGFTARTVIGQSYQLAGDNNFIADSGLGTTSSDYVTGLYIDIPSYFRLISQVRMDEEDFDIRRIDIQGAATYGPLDTSLTYVKADAQPELGFVDDREELLAAAAVRVTETWSLFGDVRYDFERDMSVEHGLGVKYTCDCFILSVKYAKSTVRDRDVEPEETILVRFDFKTLGSVDVKTDAIDGFSASDDDSK